MKRKWHYLKTNKNNETINYAIFVDVETDRRRAPEKMTAYPLRFGWACIVRRKEGGKWGPVSWKRFTDTDDFWLWVQTSIPRRKKCWIWCHNSNFDYVSLDAYRKLPALGWKLESLIIDGPPTVVRYSHDSKTLVLCDTLNIWRMPLKKLAKLANLEKMDMPRKWGDKDKDDEYCKRDVEIIQRAVCDWTDFLKANSLGGFCPTIAAQSMRTFRHRFMSDRILIDADEPALDVSRNSYHGGRCEAGYIGHVREPVYYVDVNSMYPHVMASYEMPVRLKRVLNYVHPSRFPKLLAEYCVCAHVRLCTDEPAYPYRDDGKLTFPVGRFDAYLTSGEIQYACERGHIVDVNRVALYDKCFALREFALTLYRYKQEASIAGDDVRKEQWKLLLNSFYGKWGQNGRHWVEIGETDPDLFCILPDICHETGKVTYFRHFGGTLSRRAEDRESYESHPAIAAHITGHARMILWTLIKKIPPEQYLYCDTDGLLVLEEGFNKLADVMHDDELGKLKHVKTYGDVVIHGCKDLILDGKQKTKGIRDSAKHLGDGKYRQIKWLGLAGLLRRNSVNMPLTVPVTKTLSRTYTKGIVGPDGFVSPHVYSSYDGGRPGSWPSASDESGSG